VLISMQMLVDTVENEEKAVASSAAAVVVVMIC
jgi:hypothetical protein